VTRDGYTMMSWSREGLTFWAISDASADDVSRFHEAFAEAAGK
jgi:anti-sigma factor RsiW